LLDERSTQPRPPDRPDADAQDYGDIRVTLSPPTPRPSAAGHRVPALQKGCLG